MKGFSPISTFQGYTVAKATIHNLDGKVVADFVIGVGGYREKGIPGVFIRCHAWGSKAKLVAKVIHCKGLAVKVAGGFSQTQTVKYDTPYVNNDLVVWQLAAQKTAASLSLSEIAFPTEIGGGSRRE